MNDYLWNRTGEPDPETEGLERVLSGLRHRPRPLDFSRAATGAAPPAPLWTRARVALAVAACVALVAAASWFAASRTAPAPQGGGWLASPVEGAPTIADSRLRGDARVAAGAWIETDAASSVRLRADDIGVLELGPGSRLRVVPGHPGGHRFALEQGRLHALIWAPPGRFLVDTPSAAALDLGCRYTLEVNGRGEGRLQVTSGWVGLDSHGVESLVPEGASCRLRAGAGPGTPYFDDAPAALVEAVSRIDEAGAAAPRDAVVAAAAAARPRDAFTLWHLLSRLDATGSAVIYDRLVQLVPPPSSVRREDVLSSKDRGALDAWWDGLGLGSSRLFRTWRARPGI